jgi:hypothetical protein
VYELRIHWLSRGRHAPASTRLARGPPPLAPPCLYDTPPRLTGPIRPHQGCSVWRRHLWSGRRAVWADRVGPRQKGSSKHHLIFLAPHEAGGSATLTQFHLLASLHLFACPTHARCSRLPHALNLIDAMLAASICSCSPTACAQLYKKVSPSFPGSPHRPAACAQTEPRAAVGSPPCPTATPPYPLPQPPSLSPPPAFSQPGSGLSLARYPPHCICTPLLPTNCELLVHVQFPHTAHRLATTTSRPAP